MSDGENRRVVLAARPQGLPEARDFRVERSPLPAPAAGQMLVRTIYLSLDPYVRPAMDERPSYIPPIALGGVIYGGAVGEVVASEAPAFAPGDVVEADLGWQAYGLVKAERARKIDPALGPLSSALGVLGMTGLTAYAGLIEVGRPKAGETVFVSAAAGAVGGTVGQIARIKGCRTAGSAGSDEKAAYCREVLGFDAAFNYKTAPDLGAAVAAACPEGVDIYFDNVGGALSDAVFERLNPKGRLVACGAISTYNSDDTPLGPRREWGLIEKRLRLEGFIVTDFDAATLAHARARLAAWLKSGALVAREDIVDGLENAPAAFRRLFEGRNFGKLLVKVGPEPD